MSARVRAVSFDFGQTLAALDEAMLVRRVAERGVRVELARVEASVPAAWAAYDARIREGVAHHPWKHLMRTLLEGAGVTAEPARELADWLWDEQPEQNLWRKPLPGMIELCCELDARGVPIGVLSNSEGRLAELIEELGWQGTLRVVADSGRLGVEKPDRAIFDWLAERLGVAPEEVLHVGDSLAADVEGALRAGMRAVWFKPGAEAAQASDPSRAFACASAADLRSVLVSLGLLPP